jgi:hypothetical protein
LTVISPLDRPVRVDWGDPSIVTRSGCSFYKCQTWSRYRQHDTDSAVPNKEATTATTVNLVRAMNRAGRHINGPRLPRLSAAVTYRFHPFDKLGEFWVITKVPQHADVAQVAVNVTQIAVAPLDGSGQCVDCAIAAPAL